jgi:hypothetical protein
MASGWVGVGIECLSRGDESCCEQKEDKDAHAATIRRSACTSV